MRKKIITTSAVVAILIIITLFAASCSFSRPTDYDTPNKMMFYSDGRACEVTNARIFNKLLRIADQYQAQADEDWQGVPNFYVDAADADTEIINQFPGSWVIAFIYDDRNVYFNLDKHYTITVTHHQSLSTPPEQAYAAFSMISEQTCYCYSKEMEQVVLHSDLYDRLE